jgi:hypothetical protein
VSLQPDHAKRAAVPGVVFRPLRDSDAKWTMLVAWQRGKASAAVKALIAAFPTGG